MLKLCLLLCGVFLINAVPLQTDENFGRCRDILTAAGATADFGARVGHAIHSMSLRNLKKFEPSVTEDNRIPTINLNLTSDTPILLYAPDRSGPHSKMFHTEGMKILDEVGTLCLIIRCWCSKVLFRFWVTWMTNLTISKTTLPLRDWHTPFTWRKFGPPRCRIIADLRKVHRVSRYANVRWILKTMGFWSDFGWVLWPSVNPNLFMETRLIKPNGKPVLVLVIRNHSVGPQSKY